ncbi:uncharacterized protein LOC113348254 [Papaver somniferum]|uniref:uncharacterized protein LOC113273356 n=1 Tax=Papaver somniferum TaxID=3469 RepID=UPI000E6FDEF6|nr:uncharacterized protein LOC113273356 [Papaver somniferum]XP_026447749.1 uncharacterized protein LOC113348254 [Papaver somniferum]
MATGDWNQILSEEDKQGGAPFIESEVEPFKRLLVRSEVRDFVYQREKFTWNNHRGGSENIQERLDKAFINVEWKNQFIDSSLNVLIPVGSNHCPLLLNMEGKIINNSTSYFKFFDTWLKEQSCLDLINSCRNRDLSDPTGSMIFNLQNLRDQLIFWRKNVCGLPTKKIKKLLSELEKLNKQKLNRNIQQKINSKMLRRSVPLTGSRINTVSPPS